MMLARVLLLAVLLAFAAAARAWACTTVIVGKAVSSTGKVLVGHNEDAGGGRIVVRHAYVGARDWDEGAVLPAEEGRAAIGQVPHTLGFWWSEVRTAAGGLSSDDGFLNEMGVYCVSNSCVKSKIDPNDSSRLTEGGIEYNLRRVVAERARSARDAVDLIVSMVERYGYAPSGRAYTVADKDEAWMVQIASGRIYAAVRCPDDAVVVFPNHYTVHALDDGMICSKNIITYAKEKGYYEESGGVFDYARTYQSPEFFRHPANTFRQRHGMAMVLGRPWEEDSYPFCVRPKRKICVEDVMAVLSSHYEGTADDPAWLRAQVPGGNPHDTTLRRLCAGTTVESAVCQFAASPLLTTLWTAFGRPCEIPFIPLHPLAGVPRELDVMEDPHLALENHLASDPRLAAWNDSGWMRLKEFERLADLVYQDCIGRLTVLNQARIQAMKAADEAAVLEAERRLSSGDEAQARGVLAAAGQKAATGTLALLERFARTLRTASVSVGVQPSLESLPGILTARFVLKDGLEPLEETLRLGLGGSNTRTEYLGPAAGSLRSLGGGAWEADFDAPPLAKGIPAPGKYDFYLGGLTAAGLWFAGEVVITFKR